MAERTGEAPALTAGITAYDEKRATLGTVMEVRPTRVALRPPKGGLEWWAERTDVRPATAGETLSASVAAANRRSREGGAWL